jgi:hypothetical protein
LLGTVTDVKADGLMDVSTNDEGILVVGVFLKIWKLLLTFAFGSELRIAISFNFYYTISLESASLGFPAGTHMQLDIIGGTLY